ncbi:MAG: hypothetical protein DRQ51_08585 [Gammaproteobacteria bacterium]|nr:MAG: hypothetical protein DRQ51_08585 [Gammaproteobacteria bacterium]
MIYCPKCLKANKNKDENCQQCHTSFVDINTPLDGGDRVKVMAFFVIMALTFGSIIPPAIILIAIYIMKKDKKFSPIIKIENIIDTLYWLAIIASILAFGNWFYYNQQDDHVLLYMLSFFVTIIGATVMYFLFSWLFFKPLLRHNKWVAENGIFSNIITKKAKTNSAKIIGHDKLSSFSVADEMIKWHDLLKKGLISQEEFDQAKQKLLNQSN